MRTGLAAAALIICISMGYMACSRMRDRVDKLNALCAEIRTLGDSMELSQYRLSEMLDRLGGELWREYTAALSGLVLTLSMVADLIGDLFENVRRIFELY